VNRAITLRLLLLAIGHLGLEMTRFADQPLVAVLGPTNTGKTHLAVERMCAHSSGLIGFPLRLLAREVYDRVVAIKGEKSVALVTGEEKIVPPKARYFLTTAESDAAGRGARNRQSPERDFAFVGLDEAQLGADPRARPRLHRSPAACAWARGDDDPRLGSVAADAARAGARGRDHHPAALLDVDLCRARPSRRACPNGR
jgi:hypothetical protein